MATDILTRVIDVGINRKLAKLEQSATKHNAEIIFCENLVEEINKLFIQLNINLPEEESKEKENLCIYYSVDDNLNEKSFASSKTSIQHNNSVLQHLQKEEPKKRTHHKVQSMAYNSTRTEKTPMRSTPKNNNHSFKKDQLTDKKSSTKPESANVNTPSALDKKETKRLIKTKTISQDMTMTPEMNLKKKNFVGNLNGQFATNTKEKTMKKEKSFVVKSEAENYKTTKIKSLISEGSTKKIETKSRAKTPKANSNNEAEKKFTNLKPFVKTNSQVNVMSPEKRNAIKNSKKEINSPDKSNEKTLKKHFTSGSKFKDKFSKEYNTSSTNKKESQKNEENFEEKICRTPIINSDIHKNLNQNILESKPKLNIKSDSNNLEKNLEESSVIKIVSNLVSSNNLENESSIKKIPENKDKENSKVLLDKTTKKELFKEHKKLSLREVFLNEFENISKYLNKSELLSLRLMNKNFYTSVSKEFKKYFQLHQSLYTDKINQLFEKNPVSEVNKEVPPFILTRGTIKAIELLNESIYTKLFLQTTTPNEDILFPYKIYFQFLKSPILKTLPNEALFWAECCKFFLNDTNGKAGDFINNSVKNFDFSEENIYVISKLCENKEKKISPQFFSKVCGTTGLIIFLIRDALEYTGIIIDKKTLPGRLLKLYKYAQEKILNIQENFNKFYNKFLIVEEKIKHLDSKEFSEKENSPNNKKINIISSSLLQNLSPIRSNSIKENNNHQIDLKFINTSLESDSLANSILTPTKYPSKKELDKIDKRHLEMNKKEDNNDVSDKQMTYESNEKNENTEDKLDSILRSNDVKSSGNPVEKLSNSIDKTINENTLNNKDANLIKSDVLYTSNKDDKIINAGILDHKNILSNEVVDKEKNKEIENKNSLDSISNTDLNPTQQSNKINNCFSSNTMTNSNTDNLQNFNESSATNNPKSLIYSSAESKSPLEVGKQTDK